MTGYDHVIWYLYDTLRWWNGPRFWSLVVFNAVRCSECFWVNPPKEKTAYLNTKNRNLWWYTEHSFYLSYTYDLFLYLFYFYKRPYILVNLPRYMIYKTAPFWGLVRTADLCSGPRIPHLPGRTDDGPQNVRFHVGSKTRSISWDLVGQTDLFSGGFWYRRYVW